MNTLSQEKTTDNLQLELLNKRLADEFYKIFGGPRIGNMVIEDNDNSILKEPDGRAYAKAKFDLNKFYSEKLLDDNPLNLSARYRELSKTVLLALPEKTQEAINLIKNSAIKCIEEKDSVFASRAMTGVGIALSNIANKKPELHDSVKEAVDAIIATDKDKKGFGPAKSLECFMRDRAAMANRYISPSLEL